jgi:hypothetical protein
MRWISAASGSERLLAKAPLVAPIRNYYVQFWDRFFPQTNTFFKLKFTLAGINA